jgi:hypothetical protein
MEERASNGTAEGATPAIAQANKPLAAEALLASMAIWRASIHETRVASPCPPLPLAGEEWGEGVFLTTEGARDVVVISQVKGQMGRSMSSCCALFYFRKRT